MVKSENCGAWSLDNSDGVHHPLDGASMSVTVAQHPLDSASMSVTVATVTTLAFVELVPHSPIYSTCTQW